MKTCYSRGVLFMCLLLHISCYDAIELSEYKEAVWTSDSYLSVSMDFSLVLPCLESDGIDCCECLNEDKFRDFEAFTPSINDTTQRLAAYLLSVAMDPEYYCSANSSNNTMHGSYIHMLQQLRLVSTSNKTPLTNILNRINVTLEHEHHVHTTEETVNYSCYLTNSRNVTEEEHHEHHHVRCFSADTILLELDRTLKTQLQSNEAVSLPGIISRLIINKILSGHVFREDCHAAPTSADIITDLLRSIGLAENITSIPHHKFEELVTQIRSYSGDQTAEADEHDHAEVDDHHDHPEYDMHKRDIHGDAEISVSRCMSAEELLETYGLGEDDSIPVTVLPDLSLALIQQIVGNYCISHTETDGFDRYIASDLEKWGGGTLSVLIISLLALLGGLLFPCLTKPFIQDLLTVFIGLAVGTMAGDALLHLIPQAVDLHKHDSDHDHGDGITIEEYTLKMLVVIAAIYFFFIFETLMALFGGHSHLIDSHDDMNHGHSHNLSEIKEKNVSNNNAVGAETGIHSVTSSNADLLPGTNSTYALDSNSAMKKEPWYKMPALAYMIVMGDVFHNFVDGLAIGAAFASSWKEGLTISIAVLCHELPHELGDFAILLSAGLTPKKVLLVNFFCACCAFFGLYLGIAVSSDLSTRQWIFAATAGMFLYVSLVDMIPELARRKSTSKIKLFILQNIGLIVGFGCMLIIAVFENQIKL